MNANDALIIINKNTNSPLLVNVMLKWIKQNRPLSHIRRLYRLFSKDPSGLQIVECPELKPSQWLTDLIDEARAYRNPQERQRRKEVLGL